MMTVVQGTNEFNDYNVFLRAMGVVLSSMSKDDNEIAIYIVGSKNNKMYEFAMEFCNLSERGLKGRGKKIKMYKTTDSWVTEYLPQMNYFAFFSQPNQPISSLAKTAQQAGIETGIFQY